jgi:hypothetical protein
LRFRNWKGIATDEIRNERIRTTHHTTLFAANVSEHVAEVVGEHSQFKIVLSKIGKKEQRKKEQGTRDFRNKGKRLATEGLAFANCGLRIEFRELLIAN